METTIIKLDGNIDSNLVVRTATFEEAFGEFSEARGRGRERRKKRRLERIKNRREVRTERRKLREDRQQERIARRAGRKRARQAMRTEQQSARMERRGNRLAMRQQRADARQMRKDTRTQGEQGRANYEAEQELYRENLNPEIAETQDQGGFAPQDQGGYAPQDQDQNAYFPQDQGGYASQDQGGYAPQENNSPMPQEGWGGGSYEDLGYDQGFDQGAYGDDNTFENDYNQEQDEFGDEGYFNAEGMEGKAVVSPYVKDNVQKLKNNVQAYAVLSKKRKEAVANNNSTKGLDRLLARVKSRCLELKSNLDDYSNASGDLQENVRRRREVAKALKQIRKRKRRNLTAVQSSLQPQISSNRIEIPSSSNFDAYSDLGRPIIVNGAVQSDMGDIMEDIYSDTQPTTIEMQSSFSGENGNKTIPSVLLGIGIGALALYFAKRKGWI